MKKHLVAITLSICSLLVVPNVLAANSEVIWTDYKKYHDIKSGDGGDKQFREIVFFNLGKHFTKLATQLPEGQTLKIEVTNIDLAGDTRIAGINDIRVIKSGYPPRMSFSYQLLDEKGSVIKSEDVNLKDLNFIENSQLKYRHDSFGHEKKMLDDWLKKTFSSILIK